jgi:hypothetical protein
LSNKDIIKKLRDKYENAKTFTEEQSVKYNEIKKFTNKNQTNFGLIDTQYHEDIKILNDYFASDTEPWNKLHIIIDIYKKLKKTIEDKTKELQAKAISIYQEKYAQLEKKRKELKIDNDKVHYDSFEDIKNSIQKLDYILK